ncbi:MAG: hypothetical protein QXO19_01120 [Candidatus Aenigmatarchaeota archaeon]
MLCIISFFIFAVLGIFSAKYREYAKESFKCIAYKITLRPCESSFDEKIKTALVSKILPKYPKIAKILFKHFELFAWIFTITFIVTGAYTVYGIYNLFVFGTCDPQHPENCPFSANETCIINETSKIKSFKIFSGPICTENGKPIIRMFSTSFCPHCTWAGPAFDKIAKEYVDKGLIVAYHWDLDTKDNLLTLTKEGDIPNSEIEIYKKFNPEYTVPTYIFGCRYYRIGNAFERENNLTAEEEEFRAVIEEILKEK